jgi:tetratricopeptide (TPR) repeat protein
VAFEGNKTITSLPLPATDATISKLLCCTVTLSLLASKGGDDAAEPEVVGVAMLPLSSVVNKDTPNRVSTNLSFLAPEGSATAACGSVQAVIDLDDVLHDHVLGGVAVNMYSLVVADLPECFKIVPEFEAATMTADEYHLKVQELVKPAEGEAAQAFDVSIAESGVFPAMFLGAAELTYTPGENGESVSVDLTEEEIAAIRDTMIKSHEMVLASKAEAAVEAAAEAGESEEKKDSSAEEEEVAPYEPDVPTTREVPVPTGTWSLVIKPKLSSNSLEGGRFFLSVSSVAQLAAGSGTIPLPLTVTRSGRTTSFGAAAAAAAPAEVKKGKPAKGAAADTDAGEPPVVLTGLLFVDEIMLPGARLARGSGRVETAEAAPVEGDEAPAVAALTATVTAKLALSAPLSPDTPASLEITQNMGSVVGMRTWKPKKKPRDVAAELRVEIEAIATECAESIRALKGSGGSWSPAQLFASVQSSGQYFRMKERLLPFVQRAAHSRFRSAPATPEEYDSYRSELFAALSTQLNTVLVNKFTANKAVDADLFPMPADEFSKDFAAFSLRAAEAAAFNKTRDAMLRHEDAVSIGRKAKATGDESGTIMLANAWDNMAKYCLVSGTDGRLDRALECMRESESIRTMSADMKLIQALTQLDGGMYDDAEKSFTAALASATEATPDLLPQIHGGLCVLHTTVDSLEAATYSADKESLRLRGLPMTTFHARDLTRAKLAKSALKAATELTVGAPARRRGVVAMIDVATICVDYSLVVAAEQALELAGKCENLAAEKEEEIGATPSPLVSVVHGRRSRLDSTMALLSGRTDAARDFAEQAIKKDGKAGVNYEALGQALEAILDVGAAATAYRNAEIQFEASGDVPIRIYLKLSDLYVRGEEYEKAKVTAFKATKKFGSGAAWRLAAIACMKLAEPESALKAFEESLRIDPFSPSTWAHLSLFIMDDPTASTAQDGVVGCKQAIVNDLDEPHLLRQLGERLYMIGEFGMAEDMLRRSLVLINSSVARKILGDVLRAQKRLDESLGEYVKLLDDEDFTLEEKQELFAWCVEDLKILKKDKERHEFIEKYRIYT